MHLIKLINMSKKINAKARVQITVEVEASAWGEDCSIGQLYKQAAESATETLLKVLKTSTDCGRIAIIGEPKVIGVLTESIYG
jgi:hypothetical protein